MNAADFVWLLVSSAVAIVGALIVGAALPPRGGRRG